jgi:hypothetical protein
MNTPPLQWSAETASAARSPVELSYEANAAELGAIKRYAGVEDVTDFTAQVRIYPLRRPVPRVGNAQGQRGAGKRHQP